MRRQPARLQAKPLKIDAALCETLLFAYLSCESDKLNIIPVGTNRSKLPRPDYDNRPMIEVFEHTIKKAEAHCFGFKIFKRITLRSSFYKSLQPFLECRLQLDHYDLASCRK